MADTLREAPTLAKRLADEFEAKAGTWFVPGWDGYRIAKLLRALSSPPAPALSQSAPKDAAPAPSEDEARDLFNDWYDKQPMPQLLARIDPQQAAHNAFEFGRSLASPAALPVGVEELREALLFVRPMHQFAAIALSDESGDEHREAIERIDAALAASQPKGEAP